MTDFPLPPDAEVMARIEELRRELRARAEGLKYPVLVHLDGCGEPVLIPVEDLAWANPATGGLAVRIDFGGQPRNSLHWLLNISLPVSLWSPDPAVWETHAPGAWARMEAIYTGQSTDRYLVVQTAAPGLDRYGTVIFNPGLARVHFWAERQTQDETPDLFDTVIAQPFADVMAAIASVEAALVALQNAPP